MAINRDKVLEAAQKYVEKKKYDKAVAELRKLIEADPNDARTLLKIGDLQAKQSLYADAIGTYETVGRLYASQGFSLKAIAVYKQIREIIAKYVPQLEERYGHIAPKLAELYQQLGLTSDALAALDEVATRLQRQQRDEDAIDVFRKIVELDPTNPLPHLRLAEALSRLKDVEGAVYEFRTAAAQLAGIGRRDDAIKVLERLLHHKPDPDQAKTCAELYLSRGHPQDGMQALAKLQICFQANPRDFDTLSLLARAFNAIGQGAKAIEVQKEMARVARDTGKTDLFREILERLLRVAPHDEGVRRLAQQAGGAAAPAYASVASEPVEEPPPERFPPLSNRNAATAWGQPAAAHSPPPRPRLEQSASAYVSYDEEEIEELTDAEIVEDGDAYVEEGEAYLDESEAAYTNERGGGAPHDDAARGYARPSPYGADAVFETNPYDGAPRYDPYGAAHVAEAARAPSSRESAASISAVLADADAFRRVRLYKKALQALQAGLHLAPRSMELHEVYRDVLIESGLTEEAVQEMLAIATLYVDALDGDSAARALQDVLAFDPENARALEMLQELGYEVVDENDAVAQGDGDAEDQRLPSYDLEEMGPADVSASYADNRQIQVRSQGFGGALPSFPLDDAEAREAYASSNDDVVDDDAPDDGMAPPPAFGRAPSQGPLAHAPGHAMASAPSAAGASRELEDALEEAEFFCSRGLFDDARTILAEQLGKHPNNPLVRERLAEIDAQEAERGSGAREKPRDQEDRAFDIAASLDALEGLDYADLQPAEGHVHGDEQIDVEEVFAKFKEGVAKQISADDSDSHYNLGIAYKEMLLLDDAIREFDLAAMDPKRECVCRSMIGMINIERGNVNEAIEAFMQGLNASIKDPSQETVLCFEIGAAYEAKKVNKDALTYYQKAMRRDPNYRDVQERVRRLSKAEPKQAVRQAAVGADDEFDRAFDDLLSKA